MIITYPNVMGRLVSYPKENIVSGAQKVGEKISSEGQLTETLGVSRANARTAIQQMVGLDILESRHGKGIYVMDNQIGGMPANKGKITAQDCKDLQKALELKRIVETEIRYPVIRYATSEFINELRRRLDTMASNRVSKESFITANTVFHRFICRESRNPLPGESMSKISEEVCKDQGRTYELFGLKDGIYYHTLALNVIRSGDAKRTGKCMYEYLQAAIDRLNEPE